MAAVTYGFAARRAIIAAMGNNTAPHTIVKIPTIRCHTDTGSPKTPVPPAPINSPPTIKKTAITKVDATITNRPNKIVELAFDIAIILIIPQA
jgi:hypothetical protein